MLIGTGDALWYESAYAVGALYNKKKFKGGAY